MLFDDGFDSIELIMAIEDGFGISVPAKDAEHIQTVGQLSDYLSQVVGATAAAAVGVPVQSRCVGAAAFFMTRRRLAANAGASVHDIRPGTPMDRLLPRVGRRAAWRRLGHDLGVALPPLEFPPLLAAVPFCVVAIGLVAGVALQSATPVLCAAAGFVVLMFALGIAESFLGSRVPSRFQTVGEVSTLLMPKVLGEAKGAPAALTEQEIWQVVRSLVARLAGVSPSHVTRETNFLRDLV